MAHAPDPRRFHRPYRVRFDEAGPDGLLRTSGLLRYAQDVAWVHSEALGFDRAWYVGRDLAWLVRAAELEVVGPIPMGAEIDVTTSVVGYRKVWARRRSEMSDTTGALVAWVHTDWVLVDGRGAPTRIPPEFGVAFPGAPGDVALIRVGLDGPGREAQTRDFRVRRQELDPNDHPNNAAYLDWLEESVVELGGSVGEAGLRYQLEYLAPAEPGADVRSTTWRDPAGWAHGLAAADGTQLLRARIDG